jgi:iron(III) transport system permease protein
LTVPSARPGFTRRGFTSTGERVALLAAVLATAGLVLVPLGKLVQLVSSDGWSSIRQMLTGPGMGTATWHSLAVAAAVTLLAVPLGAAIAVFLGRADVPCRGLLRLAMLGPLIVPQFVLGYSWTQAYGRAGFTDSLVGVHWAGLFGPAGVIVVLVVDTVPLCYLLCTVGLATRAAPDLERAARTSGAGGWTVLRTVTVPLLRPVLAAAAVLTFVATLESFAVPEVLGTPGGFSTLTVRIYSDLTLGSDPRTFVDAITGSLSLVLIAAVLLVPADLVLAPKLRATRTGSIAGALLPAGRSEGAWLGASLLAAYLALAVALPVVAIVAASITRAVGLAPTPSNWTLANFRSALDAPTRAALGNSLQLAALAATVLTLLGALVAVLERRRAGRALGSVVVLTFTIPGTALAVGLLVAYGRWFGTGLGLILIAYLAKFWALSHRTVTGALDRLPPAEWQAARASGAGPATAARTIWLPALTPALVGAWVLVFLGALHEVTMSSLLYTFGNQTLAVAVLNSQQLGDVGTTAALSVVLTALILLVALPAALVLRVRVAHQRAPAEVVHA